MENIIRLRIRSDKVNNINKWYQPIYDNKLIRTNVNQASSVSLSFRDLPPQMMKESFAFLPLQQYSKKIEWDSLEMSSPCQHQLGVQFGSWSQVLHWWQKIPIKM